MAEKKKRGYLADAWLVLCLAVGFGVALAGVHMSLKDKIAQNKLDKTLDAIPDLVPGAHKGVDHKIGDKLVYKAMDDAGKQVGWVIPAVGDGYADRIELLVGVDLTVSKITGLFVLSQKETPGLGDNITKDYFYQRFVRKDASKPVTCTKAAPAGNQIEALSGATISSQSVCKIVNNTLSQLRKKLIAEAKTE